MNMKTVAAASAALGIMLAASSANALVTISNQEEGNLFGPLSEGQIIYDFDAIAAPNVIYVGNVLQGPLQTPNTASPPYNGSVNGDDTKYASVQANTVGTFSTLNGFALSDFSFYLGSPDDYNTVTFNFLGGGSQTLTGNEIWGPGVAGDGDRTKGYRIYYDFGGDKVTSIVFGTGSTNAFEFDGLAATITAVPEPATWAMMILGFGAAGAMIRRRNAVLA